MYTRQYKSDLYIAGKVLKIRIYQCYSRRVTQTWRMIITANKLDFTLFIRREINDLAG